MTWLSRFLCSHAPEKLIRERDQRNVLHLVCECGHKVPVRFKEPAKYRRIVKQFATSRPADVVPFRKAR